METMVAMVKGTEKVTQRIMKRIIKCNEMKGQCTISMQRAMAQQLE